MAKFIRGSVDPCSTVGCTYPPTPFTRCKSQRKFSNCWVPQVLTHIAQRLIVSIMANPLNVYRGPDSVRSYFDPDSSPPLPLVEIPDQLNPYREDGVRIYAKMMSMHPANNVKSMPG